jgi:hypothetical protein
MCAREHCRSARSGATEAIGFAQVRVLAELPKITGGAKSAVDGHGEVEEGLTAFPVSPRCHDGR